MSDFMNFAKLERPNSPNTCFFAPAEMYTAKIDGSAPVYKDKPQELFERIFALLETSKSVRNLGTDPAAFKIKYVDVTRLMRFKDDIDIEVLPAEAGSTFAIYSRSRVGHSDLGKNRKRIKTLIQMLE